MSELPTPQGVQPVLDAIDQLHGELASYPPGNTEFERVRSDLEEVLDGVKQTLINACNQYTRSTNTYLGWMMQDLK